MKRIHLFAELERAFRTLTFVERSLFFLFFGLLIASVLGMLTTLNNRLLVEIPARGGSFTEGIVGTPRFVNPLLATSDADRDTAALVYAGLMKATPDGMLVHELADRHTISDDGRTYTFTLKDNITFHDGTPITADDVVYTITLAQDPELKSPRRANWEGVAVEKIDARTISFTLSRVYQPFLESTTLGILPMHLWSATTVEQIPFSNLNLEPIGAGPYRITDRNEDSSGIITRYALNSFRDYALGTPYIAKIALRFYPNQEALLEAFGRGDIDTTYNIVPNMVEVARNKHTVHAFPLPRIFAVFFNQDEASVFTDIAVRAALSRVIDRDELIANVLEGYGTAIDGPIPPGLVAVSQPLQEETLSDAQAILERNDWTFDAEENVYVNDDNQPLSFTLTTANTTELNAAAEHLKARWDKLGADVTLELFDAGVLSSDIIRPRHYDALLFGQIIGRDRDPFPFWHSSQRNDPGLNVALYANIAADAALEDLRTTFDEDRRNELYKTFQEEVASDIPAAFIFTPDFIYLTNETLSGIQLGIATTPAERFLNVHEWYIHTDRVWSIFAPTATS